MNYPVALEGFEGQRIVVQPSFWTGPKLLVNGEVAAKGPKRGQMLLRRNDGGEVVAAWRSQLIDVPQLVVDGQVIKLVEPLKWYEWAWNALPIVLGILGGLVGVVAGLVAFSINAQVFRSAQRPLVKYVVTGLVSLSAVIVYVLVVLLMGG